MEQVMALELKLEWSVEWWLECCPGCEEWSFWPPWLVSYSPFFLLFPLVPYWSWINQEWNRINQERSRNSGMKQQFNNKAVIQQAVKHSVVANRCVRLEGLKRLCCSSGCDSIYMQGAGECIPKVDPSFRRRDVKYPTEADKAFFYK